MRSMIPLLALLFIGGKARALSAMPNGEGNPYPIAFALLGVIALVCFAYLAADWLTGRIVKRMKEKSDVEGLTRSLKSAWLACKAARALGDLRDADAVEPLAEALGDRNDEVRQAAARALGDIGDGRAIGPLTRALGDRYRGVRECASDALRKIRRPCL